MNRLPLLLVTLLSLTLLPACTQTAPPTSAIQATELNSGTAVTTVDVQVPGEVDPRDGTYLVFQAENNGTTPIILSAKSDPETKPEVLPGESGTLSLSLSPWTRDYLFLVHSANPGSEVNVTYTVTQSTAPPAE